MGILGIGTDIIEIDRIQHNINRYESRFLNRIFTLREQEYCMKRKYPALHFAGRFAAKEAVVKALGTGFSQNISWTDIEVSNDEFGKPLVVLSPHVNALFNFPLLHLSISHCRQYATAFAVWVDYTTCSK